MYSVAFSSAKGIRTSVMDEGSGPLTQYCNKVFGGWDFCISDQKAAKDKHKNLCQELRVNTVNCLTEQLLMIFLIERNNFWLLLFYMLFDDCWKGAKFVMYIMLYWFSFGQPFNEFNELAILWGDTVNVLY